MVHFEKACGVELLKHGGAVNFLRVVGEDPTPGLHVYLAPYQSSGFYHIINSGLEKIIQMVHHQFTHFFTNTWFLWVKFPLEWKLFNDLSRFLIGIWLLTGLLVSAAFSGNLKGFLTNPGYYPKIDTLQKVLDSGLPFYWNEYTSASVMLSKSHWNPTVNRALQGRRQAFITANAENIIMIVSLK